MGTGGSTASRLRERLAGERGVTLVELVTAMALAIVVIGAPLALMIVSLRQHDDVASRTDSVRQAEVGLNKLTRDLRQADPTQAITLTWGSGAATASFSVVKPGTGAATDQTVVWTCTANGSCTRKVGSGVAAVQIAHVVSTTFTSKNATGATLTSPTASANPPVYVGITISVQPVSQDSTSHTARPAGIKGPLTIETGVDLWGNS
jgi:Tfp pilus assembly protein PilW